jgi:hypothetical protein
LAFPDFSGIWLIFILSKDWQCFHICSSILVVVVDGHLDVPEISQFGAGYVGRVHDWALVTIGQEYAQTYSNMRRTFGLQKQSRSSCLLIKYR